MSQNTSTNNDLYLYVEGKKDKLDYSTIGIQDLNPEKFSYIVQGMIDKKIQTTKILEMIVIVCKDSYGLALTAICLRLGANPNVYVPIQGTGEVHILGVVSKNKNNYDPKIFLLLLTTLIHYGSNPAMPVFNQSQALLQDKPLSSQSVVDWYISNGYGTELAQLTQDKTFTALAPQLRKEMIILTDNADLYKSLVTQSGTGSIGLEDMELAILAQSKNITTQFIFFNASNPSLYVLYDWVIKYYATSIPIELVKARCYPYYYQVNHIILKMQLCAKGGYTSTGGSTNPPGFSYQVLLLQLVSILKTLVISGIDIDLYQFTMIKLVNDSIAKIIMDAYDVPYWKKSCSIPSGQPTTRLIQLARVLQYQGGDSKQEICSFIKNVSESDQTKIVGSAVNRQKERIAIMNSSPSDFVSGRPTGVCYNTMLSGDEIYEYADMDIASYKDQHGHIYCFTRDLFPNLLETKTNPYTREPLPPTFLEALTRQYALLQTLGVQGPPETLGVGLKRLMAPDQINNDLDNQIIMRFNAEARKNMVPESALQRSSLVPPITTTVLQNFGHTVIMEGLTPDHQYVTFVRTFMDDYQRDPSKGAKFFEFMRIAYQGQ